MKPKELLHLESGKIYVLKIECGMISIEHLRYFVEKAGELGIHILPLFCSDINKVILQEKYGNK